MGKFTKLYQSLCKVRKCRVCAVTKPLSEFKINKECVEGRIKTCRDCISVGKHGRIRKLKTALTKSFEYPDGTKLCTQCKQVKPKSDFRLHSKKSGRLHSKCFICITDNLRFKNYGITGDEYRAMLNDQNGVCKICSGSNWNEKFLYVDHCHSTGKVRGILCSNCNMGIGLFQDNITLMQKAIEYLNQ